MYNYVLAASRRVNSRICARDSSHNNSNNIVDDDPRINDRMAETRTDYCAEDDEQDFNRTGLRVDYDKACYTSQRAQKIPAGLINVVGHNCKSLDLSFNELSSLGALRDFVDLEQLVLDNNCLRSLRSLPSLPRVTTLSLNNNKIVDVESALERIAHCCPKLSYLSLLGNPGYPAALTTATVADQDEADYERFRLYVVYALPDCLRFLDSRAVSPRERLRARERGILSRTVRPRTSRTFHSRGKAGEEFDEIYFRVHYTPLPSQTRSPGDLRSTYGKCHYRYTGKHSEGNRYILNSDL